MGAPLTRALVEVYYTFLKILLTIQPMSLYLERLWEDTQAVVVQGQFGLIFMVLLRTEVLLCTC